MSAPKVHSFAFVKECTDGAVLEAIEGTITYINDRKSGQGEHGEWSFQTIALTDASGERLDVKLKDRPELTKDWKGRTVRICSKLGDRGRTGLQAITETDRSSGKTYQKAKATPTATILDLASAASGSEIREAVEQKLAQQQPAQHQRTQAPSQAPAQAQRQAAPASGDEKEILKRTKLRIARLAGLQAICYDAAAQTAHGIYERHGIAIMPGAVGVMGDKLFMEVARKTDIDLLPIDPYAIYPFKGRPLDELIPAMRQQIGEGKAEMEFASAEKRMEIGRQHPSAVQAAPPVAPPPTTPEPEPPFDSDEDTVPF